MAVFRVTIACIIDVRFTREVFGRISIRSDQAPARRGQSVRRILFEAETIE